LTDYVSETQELESDSNLFGTAPFEHEARLRAGRVAITLGISEEIPKVLVRGRD
jgi:hypothetical protein